MKLYIQLWRGQFYEKDWHIGGFDTDPQVAIDRIEADRKLHPPLFYHLATVEVPAETPAEIEARLGAF